ncbi:MAG: endolytic transglycosylase MltG, partial [Bifidobacteriaceae bacterium]|nr:endolytic transglycosylase MltG [Bifidobacteriaceae bacterium]
MSSELKTSPKKRGTIVLVVSAVLFVAMLGGGYLLFKYMPNINGQDFLGEGEEAVSITIPEGASTRSIAEILQDNGIVESADFFTRTFDNSYSDKQLMAGIFEIKTKMSSQAAIEALLDPANIASFKFTVPEGKTVKQVIKIIAEASETSEKSVSQAMEKAKDTLPKSAEGNFEGWLFPSTYTFPRGQDLTGLFKLLINTTVSILEEHEVPEDQWQETLIKASIVQMEVPIKDFGKAARVIENRLTTDVTGHVLGMDSTVAYGLGISGLDLTVQQLDDPENPYNTRVLPGLPPGPISNPGEDAIAAVRNP